MSDDLVKRLRANQPLPICPYDKRSPEYWTTPDDAPCKFCGGLPDGPDKCTGADMRILREAADRIEKLEAANLQQSLIKVDDMRRIEQLEAALREIAASAWDCNGKTCEHCQPNSCQNAFIARKALEGEDD